ncbi:anaerobic ribonucleoside-triphosphate reductase activating protein [Moorellaceae bacterium AZ2]
MVPLSIRGIQKTSLVDFPGQVCTSVFFGGCNWRCPWCHNPDLVLYPSTLPEIAPREVLALLERRRSWIQAVCLTGGEPALAPELTTMVKELKSRGFKVKLDTNGSQPRVLAGLLQKGLLDYVAMDIKAPPEKYSLLAGTNVELEAVEESILLLKNNRVPYEFRTTVVPGLLTEEDFLAIGKRLSGTRCYVLQAFRPASSLLDPAYQNLRPLPKALLQDLAVKLMPFFGRVEVRS